MNAPAKTTGAESPMQAIERLWNNGERSYQQAIALHLQEQWEAERATDVDHVSTGTWSPRETLIACTGYALFGVMRRFLLIVTPEPPERTHYVARGCLIDDIACLVWEKPYEERGDWTRLDNLEAFAGDVGARVEWLDQ